MATIHLIEGPVGAGKSTFTAQLCSENHMPRLILDDWMTTLFSPDRPASGLVDWYIERKNRCIEQIWKLTSEIVDNGSDIALELGLIQEKDRQQFYNRVDRAGYNLKIYVISASLEERRSRVRLRNTAKGETYSMQVPDEIFQIANNMWEPIDKRECIGRVVEFISTETP